MSREPDQFLVHSNRAEIKDMAVRENVSEGNWQNIQFVRLVAIGKRFTKVDFSNTTFDSCYLRNCQFDSCKFVGTKFISTNLHGGKFIGCHFEYATFEKTIIDESILNDNCPPHENQKMRFARSLRVNFQQIGDAAAVNHAIRVELDATGIHLFKCWSSNDRYYRTKYSGFLNRTKMFLEWLKFRFLDLIWGNGESFASLVCTFLLIIMLVNIVDHSLSPTIFSFSNILEVLWRSPQIFLGIAAPQHITPFWLTVIAFVRLITIGLFISILIKRFNRR